MRESCIVTGNKKGRENAQFLQVRYEAKFAYVYVLCFASGSSTVFGLYKGKGKGLPQQVEVAQGGPGRLRPRIFLTFGTTRVVGHQPYAPAAFTPEEIPGTHF
jgi:hypothetical protein